MTIGKDVRVPTWLFKIAVRKLPNAHYDTLAIEAPNLTIYDKAASFENAMTSTLTSIDTIEADTGLDFLNDLPVTEQQRIESRAARRLWPVSGIGVPN